MNVQPKIKVARGLVLLLLTTSLCSCLGKKGSEQTLRALEERVVLLEASLKSSQEDLARLSTMIEAPEEERKQPPPEDPDVPKETMMAEDTVSEPETSKAEPDTAKPEELSEEPEPVAVAVEAEPTASELTPLEAEIDVPTTYKAALDNYYANRFDEARDGFKLISDYHEDHKLAPNALYWLAEVAYSKYNYNQAIVLFQRVIDRYPSSAKAADALLKIGKCRERLGQDSEALSVYQQVIDDFPQSGAARLARTWL